MIQNCFTLTPNPDSRTPTLNSMCFRVPNEFVNLEAQADVQPVAQNPLGKLARVQLPEDRREDNLVNAAGQVMLDHEIAGEEIVIFVDDHELDLVFPFQSSQVIRTEGSTFAATGTFNV